MEPERLRRALPGLRARIEADRQRIRAENSRYEQDGERTEHPVPGGHVDGGERYLGYLRQRLGEIENTLGLRTDQDAG